MDVNQGIELSVPKLSAPVEVVDPTQPANLDGQPSGCKVRVFGQAIQYLGGRGRQQTVQLDLRLRMRNG